MRTPRPTILNPLTGTTRLIAALVFPVLCHLSSNAALFPPDRITTWTPGIPGGIPVIESPIVNPVTDFGAANDSSADATGAIQSALDSIRQTGGIISLPAGTYRIDSQLVFNGNRTVLRGAGADLTRLCLGFSGHSIFIGMYGRGEWQNLVDAEKGSCTITVTNGSLFTPGEFAELQQNNDSALMYTDTAWIVDWAENMIGQLFEVVSVDGNSVTFRTPLHFHVRMDLSPQIRPQRLRTYVGIEDLYLEKTAAEGHTIHIKNAAYCWVKRIESNFTRKAHIETATALGCLFAENYLHHSFGYGGGGSGYGTSLHTHTTDCLVENNIFYHLRHAMIIQNGATGNVFAWNFSTDPVQGESDSVTLNDTWDPPDISFHGHYAQYNLAEGNIVTEIGIADYWGPMGPGNTFFRNIVSGKDGIVLSDHSHYQNLAGNVAHILSDDGTSKNTILHGNILGDSATQWDSLIADHTLPASLVYDGKPVFWPDAMQWPGTGSDTGPGTSPAAERWKSGLYIPEKVPVINPPVHSVLPKLSNFHLRQNGTILNITASTGAEVTLITVDGRVLHRYTVDKKHSRIVLPAVHGVFLAVLQTDSGTRSVCRIVLP